MRRIGLAVVLVAVSLLLAPLIAQGQAGKVARIGVLMNLYAPDAAPPQALRQGLRELGYVEGQNLVIDWRYQLGQTNRLPALAAELVRLKPDVRRRCHGGHPRCHPGDLDHPDRDGQQRRRRGNRCPSPKPHPAQLTTADALGDRPRNARRL
jgi:hypothetical protein